MSHMNFRPYFCKSDEAEEIHSSCDSQNEERNDRWGMSEESTQGIVTDEPCKDFDRIDSWKDEDVNQGQGSLTAQTCANNYNLDEKDANDYVEESKYDSCSESYDRSDTLYSTTVYCAQMHALFKSYLTGKPALNNKNSVK